MADDKIKTCPHDCTRCSMPQQILCGAQMSHDNALAIRRLENLIEERGLSKDAERPEIAIQTTEEKTTEDGGGENRPSEE